MQQDDEMRKLFFTAPALQYQSSRTKTTSELLEPHTYMVPALVQVKSSSVISEGDKWIGQLSTQQILFS